MRVGKHYAHIWGAPQPIRYEGRTRILSDNEYRLILGEFLGAEIGVEKHVTLESRFICDGPFCGAPKPWEKTPLLCTWLKADRG